MMLQLVQSCVTNVMVSPPPELAAASLRMTASLTAAAHTAHTEAALHRVGYRRLGLSYFNYTIPSCDPPHFT